MCQGYRLALLTKLLILRYQISNFYDLISVIKISNLLLKLNSLATSLLGVTKEKEWLGNASYPVHRAAKVPYLVKQYRLLWKLSKIWILAQGCAL